MSHGQGALINAGLAVGHPKDPRECTLPSCRFHQVGGSGGTGGRCTAGRVTVWQRAYDTSAARRPGNVQRKGPHDLQSCALASPRRRRRRRRRRSWLGRRRKQLCPVSHLPMSRLQKAYSACAGSSMRATRPAIARVQRVNCTAGMNERKCIRTEREKQRLSSWWPKQGNNAAGQVFG